MPRSKRKSHALAMNNKRWCKSQVSDINIAEESCAQSNIRIQNLSVIEKSNYSDSEDYIIVSFKQMRKLFVSVKCPDCDMKTLQLELGSKIGFSYNLNLTCSSCSEKICTVNTSCDRKGNTIPDVNLRVTQAFSHIGKGYSAIEKFSMVMNIPPFSSRTYNKCTEHLDAAYAVASQKIFKDIHNEIKSAYQCSDSDSTDIINIGVSFDGTWLTRGHTSLIGVGCVIDILTGYVIDFEVMSKECRHCSIAKREMGDSSAEFHIWYDGHKNVCDINHTGTSGSMEMEAALVLWERSLSLGFRYTSLLSDGDGKTFTYLSEKMVYGPEIQVKKEECINHVSKRLGKALRKIVKDWRIRGVTLGGKKFGSLKETTINKLASYYQKAILRNKGDAKAMKTAIYATLFHSISTDQKPQHSKCPTGVDSWCFYQSAAAKGENPGPHKLKVGTPINEVFLPKILPVYQRLASNELLERCVRGGTQNANESLHNMIWAKCPKEIFVHKRRVKRCVIEAVCEFNKGTMCTIKETQNALGVGLGNTSKKIGVILDSRKTLFRKRRNSVKYQLARKLIKKAIFKREQLSKKKEGITYAAGYF